MSKQKTKRRAWVFEILDDRRLMAVVSQGWDGPGRGDANLTYYVSNSPAGLSKADVSAAVKTALDAWSQVASVHFTESKTPGLARQLDISFGNIDGAGGTLAQAYFPADANASRIAGDIQFDNSEHWEIGNSKGAAAMDLVRVAVHEIGHALGLEHSDSGSAILAPSVSPNESFSMLDQDDVDAILSLYAPAVALPQSPSTPAPSSFNKTTPPVSENPTSSNAPTLSRPPVASLPLDSDNNWTIMVFRTHRFRWSSGFTELYRLRRFFG